MSTYAFHLFILLLAYFLSAVAQILLKKVAIKDCNLFGYNCSYVLAAGAYGLFFLTTLMAVYAYKVIDYSFGTLLEVTSYIYVMLFGVMVFGERLTARKMVASGLILGGIAVFALCG